MDDWRSMTGREQSIQWLSLLENERNLRGELCEDSSAKELRGWWTVVGRIFRRLAEIHLPPPDPLPGDLFIALYGQFRYLEVGQIPDPIQNVAGPGRTKPGPSEQHDIQCAVTYREAVRRGIIADERPVQTIKQSFGLRSDRAVQGWVKAYQPLDWLFEVADAEDAIRDNFNKAANRYRRINSRTWEATSRGKEVRSPASK